MKIIIVPTQDDPVINQERARLQAWAPFNGWVYVEYNENLQDFLTNINNANPNSENLEIIEIDAHGNPEICNGININNVVAFAASFGSLQGFSNQTIIYLCGCNTGLSDDGSSPSLAEMFAGAAHTNVRGAAGYLVGTYCDGTAQCYSTLTVGSITYPPYIGSRDAKDPDCWNNFNAAAVRHKLTKMESIQVSVEFKNSVIHLTAESAEQLRDLIKSVTSNQAEPASALRVAPDLVIKISEGEKTIVYDLLAKSSILRERIEGRTWPFRSNKKLLSIIMHVIPY